jgi:N-acetylglucosamine-6-phosphate deacetylase
MEVNHKRIRMPYRERLVSAVAGFLFLILSGCAGQPEYDTQIEGLHYRDNTPVRISIKDGLIARVDKISGLQEGDGRLIVAPGLIDNQVNGYMGYSFVDIGKELTMEGITDLTAAFWKAGITSFLPTLTTNAHSIFIKNCKLLAEAKDNPAIRGSIVGIHLEGPYISPENGYRGAHPLIHVRKPDWEEFSMLRVAAGGNILQVTLAPETEGAMEFITRCKEAGIIAGLGHHNGSSAQITEAIDRGAVIATHLGNALANSINRWNNPLWPQLADDRLNISMICDGFHLTPEQIRVFYKTKGPEKIIMTSDMSPLGGLPPGYYLNAIGDTLELKPEGVIFYPAQNVLSGAASPLSKMIGHVMKVTGCDLATAIQMASTNPARLYGLQDRGELSPGMRADLILFTLEDSAVDIKKTVVAGEIVYESEN